jgi:hypothetical protein
MARRQVGGNLRARWLCRLRDDGNNARRCIHDGRASKPEGAKVTKAVKATKSIEKAERREFSEAKSIDAKPIEGKTIEAKAIYHEKAARVAVEDNDSSGEPLSRSKDEVSGRRSSEMACGHAASAASRFRRGDHQSRKRDTQDCENDPSAHHSLLGVSNRERLRVRVVLRRKSVVTTS